MSLQEKMASLRELATLLKDKEAVPAALWGRAGMAPNSRLKDVEKEITAIKKKVAVEMKAEAEAEREAEAKRIGVSIDEVEAKVAEEDQDTRPDHKGPRNVAKERKRTAGRDLKNANRETDWGHNDLDTGYL